MAFHLICHRNDGYWRFHQTPDKRRQCFVWQRLRCLYRVPLETFPYQNRRKPLANEEGQDQNNPSLILVGFFAHWLQHDLGHTTWATLWSRRINLFVRLCHQQLLFSRLLQSVQDSVERQNWIN
ncbi:hypothetical protein DERF_002657 [Dermatophagoides farinae]|uniref:Uncharacterized protein n=1 Tax=Dermatophagoides farinae TaxID=6954 RepID=A0A922ICU5_DERFA|nr:hypothetical protein DERF_002657 [Dermatophagoides farinae]